MKKAWVAAVVLFLAVLMVGIAQVWALEVTVGGEFRFRARERSDFDLQAYNKNKESANMFPNGLILGVSGAGEINNFFRSDAPVGAQFYGGPIPGSTCCTSYSAAFAENFFNAATGNISPLRPGATKTHSRFSWSRPHADVGNNDRDYLYDRVRVSVDAKIVEGLRAYVMFENYSDWGLSQGNLAAKNVPQVLGGDGSASIYGDRASVNIRFAWVDFVIPKTPVHVKIGRQPLALGHGILFDTRTWGGDMAYVYAPIGPVTAGAFYGKFIEDNRANEDDANFTGAHLDFAINPANKLSAFYRLVWSRTTRSLEYGDITGATFGGPIILSSTARNRSVQYNSYQHGIGMTADGKISLGKVGLFYAGEVDYIWGKYKDYTEARTAKRYGKTTELYQEDLAQSAWGYGVQLGVDLKYVKIDVAHSYGSGDKTRAIASKNFIFDGGSGYWLHQWSTGRTVETFTPWGGDGMYSPWNTDIFMASTKSANYGGSGLGTTGFTRVWGYGPTMSDVVMIKPTLQIIPFENLSADISYAAFWKTSATNSHGGGIARAVDGESTGVLAWISNANNREQPNKQKINHFLGQEINAHLVYYPYKNLMLKGWAGVFFPGDWFKVQQRNHNPFEFIAGFGTGHDNVGLKPAWALQLDVIVTF